MVIVERYTPDRQAAWDDFVRKSRNGTFLIERGFMDYHSDRFEDCSLIAFDGKQNILALLPANLHDHMLFSHQGLTYGGFIVNENMKVAKMLDVLDATLAICTEQQIDQLVYKTIPSIYHHAPAGEDQYALYMRGAQITNRSVISVIDMRNRYVFQKRRDRMVRRALQHDLTVTESEDLDSYWRLLTAVLAETHHATPVHSLAEIQLLRNRFPKNIRLHVCHRGDELLAGVLIFNTLNVAKAQYIASSHDGKSIGALDLIFTHLLDSVYSDQAYFSFGTSEINKQNELNFGLLEQKEGFGARTIVHDFYTLAISG